MVPRMPAIEPSVNLIERYTAGERIFVGAELDARVYDFSGANLAFADFSRAFITASFRGANLQGANFWEANVKTSDFSGANLQGASFAGAAIDGAVFENANLIGVSFAGATESGYTYGPQEQPSTDAA